MAVLEGSLEHFTLPDVFRLLAQNHLTGALRVERESGDGVIYFRDGEVYFAFSSLTREFLGQRLVSAKLITQGQLLRLLDEQKKSETKRLGDLLVEKGYLSRELLDTFIKEQIQDAIFNLLQWDRGTFSFEADVVSPQEVGLSVSVENLIMESSRRIEEWEVIRRKIPTLDVVVRMSPTPPDNAMEINIKPEEWTLLVLADGQRTVKDIAAAAERSDLEACKILYGLITAGLLDVGSSRFTPSETGAEAVGGAAVPAEAWMPVEKVEPAPQQVPEPASVDITEAAGPPVAEPAEVPAEGAYPQAQVVAAEDALGAEFPTPESQESAESELRVSEAVELEQEEEAPDAPVERAPTPEPQAAGRANGAPKKPGDPTISKETLLRLIAGVRNL